MSGNHVSRSDGPHLFNSFWIAGCGSFDRRQTASAPLPQFGPDAEAADRHYELLRSLAITTACERVVWGLVERHGVADCGVLESVAQAAERQGVQVVWDLSTTSLPEGLDPMSADICGRFATFCEAVALFVNSRSDGVHFYRLTAQTPNSRDTSGGFSTRSRRLEQRTLAAQLIAACDAIWSVDSDARIVHVMDASTLSPPDPSDAAATRSGRVDICEMLTGSTDQDLGGAPRYLDIVELGFFSRRMRRRQRRMAPAFHEVARAVYGRYGRPLLVGEPAIARPFMMRDTMDELCRAIALGVFFEGVSVDPFAAEDPRETRGESGALEVEGYVRQRFVEQLRWCQTILAQIGWGDSDVVTPGPLHVIA